MLRLSIETVELVRGRSSLVSVSRSEFERLRVINDPCFGKSRLDSGCFDDDFLTDLGMLL